MRIFKTTPQWNFLGRKKYAFVISAILLLASIGGLIAKGLTYGIDFRGGTLIQIQFQEDPPLAEIRELFEKRINTSVNITTFGEVEDNEVIITLSQDAIQDRAMELTDLVSEILKSRFDTFDIRRITTVGPKVGSQLKTKALQAAIFVLIGILIYIGFRFKVRYGVAAVVALFHDVLITLGIFVYLEKEFTITIVAAVLTIIGYSLNDTIVVFDRIRENVARFPKKHMEEVINISVNESLSRTILTSITTFLVVFSLFSLGGKIIHDFCFAMLIGLVVGTYSSVFVASPVVLYFDPIQLQKNPTYRRLTGVFDNVKTPFSKPKRKKA